MMLGWEQSHTLAKISPPTGDQTRAASCNMSSKQYALNHVTIGTTMHKNHCLTCKKYHVDQHYLELKQDLGCAM